MKRLINPAIVPIGQLDFSVRAIQQLTCAGMHMVSDLLATTESTLAERKVSPKSIVEVHTILSDYGFTLLDSKPEPIDDITPVETGNVSDPIFLMILVMSARPGVNLRFIQYAGTAEIIRYPKDLLSLSLIDLIAMVKGTVIKYQFY